MKDWASESSQETLKRLRVALDKAHADLIDAEARLADALAEVNAFEFEFEARVGHLWDKLEALEAEVERYQDRIQLLRKGYLPVERQFQRAWKAPAKDAPRPPARPADPANEAHVKRLYRQLARRFHPDLAADNADRARRTELMAAVNNAYAARSLVELETLAREADVGIYIEQAGRGQTERQLIQALQEELVRCQRRMREIEREMRSLHQRPSVQLSLEAKLARRQGRELLAEMAADLERRVARRTAERDMLKAQLDQLGPEHGIIPIR